MSGLIPKEQLSAYERWEMASFDEEDTPPPAAAPAPPAAPPTAAAPPGPSPEEIESIRKTALQKGFEEGFQSGQQEGRRQAAAEAARIAALIDGVQAAVAEVENTVAEDLLALAVDIAQRMVHASLRTRPEMLLPIVRDAIAALPNSDMPLALHLHPQDAVLVRQHLSEAATQEAWRIVDDPQQHRGGCRIRCGGTEIDATTDRRWRLIVEALGQDTAWLAND